MCFSEISLGITMENIFLTAVFGIILFVLIYWILIKPTNYWKHRNVPHVKSFPIIGSISDILLQKANTVQFLQKHYNEFYKEKYYGYYMFIKPILVIRDVDLINQILVKDFIHFEDRQYPTDENSELFNATLVSLTGDRWRFVRHKMTPTFSSGKLKMMFDKIKECSDEAALYLRNKLGEDIDSRDFLFKYVINTIGDIAFGLKVDALNNDKGNPFLDASRKVFMPSFKSQFAFLLALALPEVRQFLKISFSNKEINDFFHKLAQDTIKHREENGIRRNDFLQLMIDEKEKELQLLKSGSNLSVELQKKASLMRKTDEEEDHEEGELLEHLKSISFEKNYRGNIIIFSIPYNIRLYK